MSAEAPHLDLWSGVVSYLQSRSYRFEQHPDLHVARFVFTGASGSWVIALVVDDAEATFSVISCLRSKAPAHCRVTLSELLHRLNRVSMLGAFLIDLDDGEVSFRVSVDCSPITEPTSLQSAIGSAITRSIRSVDQFLPTIAACMRQPSLKDLVDAAATADRGDADE
jgi:hypothetical protein